MKLKIVSDGTSEGTNVINAETGERIELVSHIDISIDAGDIAYANIRILEPFVEIDNIESKAEIKE